MNKLETIVYRLVKSNPALKQLVRNIYQSAFDILPRQKNFFQESIDGKENYFFGFHDVSPISGDDTKILANHLAYDLKMPKPNETVEIGYFDLIDGKFGQWHKLDESSSWNYHKGCRLQWLDDNHIIFNTAVDNAPIAKIIDIEDGSSKFIPFPIDSIFINNNESLATSFSYERLERCMPGYGYPYMDGGLNEDCHPKDTGLFLIDLKNNSRTLLVSLDELAQTLPAELRENYLHFITHTEFSKDGRYISFLYRRIPKDGNYMKRWTQIRVYDRKENKIITLPTQDSGSHYVWNDKNQIIASCFIDGKNCHVLFDMEDLNHPKQIASNILNSDGHQSFINENIFVTDTYPDKRRMSRIFMCDIKNDSAKTVVKVYSPKKYQTKDFKCHIACDLHPRVSKSGKFLCFDSPFTGKRGLYIMKLN